MRRHAWGRLPCHPWGLRLWEGGQRGTRMGPPWDPCPCLLIKLCNYLWWGQGGDGSSRISLSPPVPGPR